MKRTSKNEVDERVWGRILEMVEDPSGKVRSNVFHHIVDGSPRENGYPNTAAQPAR
jgi:hypothetical protein